MKRTLTQFLNEHEIKKSTDCQRLGQRFINTYTKRSNDDLRLSRLFYEENETKALEMIKVWLEEHHYFDLPAPLKK